MTNFSLSSRACAIGAMILILPLSGCSTRLQTPPVHLKANQDVKVSFKNSEDVTRECTEILVDLLGQKQKNFDACAVKASVEAEPVVIFPNPCEYEGPYASLLCHELAHVNQMEFKEAVNHAGWKIETVSKARPVLLADSKIIKASTKVAKTNVVEPKAEKPKVAEITVAETKVAEIKKAETKKAETKVAEIKLTESKIAETKIAEAVTQIADRKTIKVETQINILEVTEVLPSDVPALRSDIPALRTKVTELLPRDVPTLRNAKFSLSETVDVETTPQ